MHAVKLADLRRQEYEEKKDVNEKLGQVVDGNFFT